MSSVFAFYPTTMGATLSPTGAEVVFLDQDPTFGEYTPQKGQKRGSVIPTLGGVQVQDFGIQVQDGRILISDEKVPGAQATLDALQAMYAAQDTDWYFTDATRCWKVRFQPGGFSWWLDEFWRAKKMFGDTSKDVYSYQIELVILEETI